MSVYFLRLFFEYETMDTSIHISNASEGGIKEFIRENVTDKAHTGYLFYIHIQVMREWVRGKSGISPF